MESTFRCQRGVSGGHWKRLAKECMCVNASPVNTDNNVVKTRWEDVGGGGEAVWREAKGGKRGSSLIV